MAEPKRLFLFGGIYGYSILAVEKKFVIFGGSSWKRKVLTNQDVKSIKTFRKYHSLITEVNSIIL